MQSDRNSSKTDTLNKATTYEQHVLTSFLMDTITDEQEFSELKLVQKL